MPTLLSAADCLEQSYLDVQSPKDLVECRFGFSWSGMEPEIPWFCQAPRWCWYYRSVGHALKARRVGTDWAGFWRPIWTWQKGMLWLLVMSAWPLSPEFTFLVEGQSCSTCTLQMKKPTFIEKNNFHKLRQRGSHRPLTSSGVSVTSQLLHAYSKKAPPARWWLEWREGYLFSTAFRVHVGHAKRTALFSAHNEYYAEPLSN